MPEQKVVIELDRDLAIFLCNCLSMTMAVRDGNRKVAEKIAHMLEVVVDRMSPEKANAFLDSVYQSVKAAWPDIKGSDPTKPKDPNCNHCTCERETCCYCGAPAHSPKT